MNKVLIDGAKALLAACEFVSKPKYSSHKVLKAVCLRVSDKAFEIAGTDSFTLFVAKNHERLADEYDEYLLDPFSIKNEIKKGDKSLEIIGIVDDFGGLALECRIKSKKDMLRHAFIDLIDCDMKFVDYKRILNQKLVRKQGMETINYCLLDRVYKAGAILNVNQPATVHLNFIAGARNGQDLVLFEFEDNSGNLDCKALIMPVRR